MSPWLQTEFTLEEAGKHGLTISPVHGGKEGQDAMSLHDTETILHLTASSHPDLQDSTSLHDTASCLHQTAKQAST